MSAAKDGRRQAHMGGANALEAKLHVPRSDSNLWLLAGPACGCS